MNKFPDTHEGNNWTVAVFQCPQDDWTKVLRDFFQFLEPFEECLVPHYTIRAYDPFTISFRILRYERDEGRVISHIREFLWNYEYEIDPDENNRFGQYNAGIRKGEQYELWTKDHCVTLNKLSKFVLDIITSDTKEKTRIKWGHLFSNMMAISEIVIIFHSLKYPQGKRSTYFDTKNPQYCESIAQYLRTSADEIMSIKR